MPAALKAYFAWVHNNDNPQLKKKGVALPSRWENWQAETQKF